MKKLLASVLVSLALCAGASAKKAKKESASATPPAPQVIPEGRQLFAAVWDYVTDTAIKNEEIQWVYVDPQKIDPQANEYVIYGFGIYKAVLTGYQKQGYTVTIKLDESGKIAVSLSDFSTVACDEKGNELSNSSPKGTGLTKYLNQMAAIITNCLYSQINKWTDEEYEAKLNDAVTTPTFLQTMKDSVSMLYYKKFIENYSVVGRNATLIVALDNLDESKRNGWQYKALTVLPANPFASGKPKALVFWVYSNNDVWLTLKNGSDYTVNGKIDSLDMDAEGNLTMTLLEN